MKYVVLIFIAAVIVRFDFIMDKIDAFRDRRAQNRIESTRIEDLQTDREIIGIEEDLNLKQSGRERFLALLESFKVRPESFIRENAIAVLKEEPTLLRKGKDSEFEGKLFELRDLFYSGNPELIRFLNALMETLSGENKATVIRFYSMLIDINPEQFLTAYSGSSDTNCLIARVSAGDLTATEKITLFEEREESLKLLSEREGTAPQLKGYAKNCLLVLGLAKDKLLNPPPGEKKEEQ